MARMRLRLIWSPSVTVTSPPRRLYQFYVCGANGSVKVAVRARPESAGAAYQFTLMEVAR